MYEVIANTPGYLPWNDEPDEFEDLESALDYAEEKVAEFVEFEEESGGTAEVTGSRESWGWHVSRSSFTYDLGISVTVVKREEDA